MANEDQTDPGLLAKAANWTKEANAAADPRVDSLLERIKKSDYTPLVVTLIVVAAVLVGVWMMW